MRGVRGVFVLLAAACAGGEEVVEWAGVERDSAGVSIVENPANDLWREGESWTAEPTLEIGVAAGDAAYEFGDVRGVALLSGGRIAVLDAQTAQVRLFGADGTALGSFGRQGSGPGELSRYADALWSEPADTLVVVDMGNRAVYRYTADGVFARAVRMPMEGGFTYYWMGDGAGLAYHNARAFAGQQADSQERLEVRAADGTLVRTVATYPARESMTGDRSGVRLQLFSPETRWAIGDSGAVWMGDTHAYRIWRYDAQGRIDRIVNAPFTARPVTDADRLFYIDAMVRLWEGRVSPAMRPQLRSATTFHSTFPVFVSLRGGPDGTLWVQPFRGPDEMPADERSTLDPERDLGSPDWHVFDRRGRRLGTVRFPPRFTPYVFAGETILGVARDADNVQRVIRLALRRSVPR